MNDNEMKIVNKAIKSVHDNEAQLSKQNLMQLNEIEGEMDYEDEPQEGKFLIILVDIDDQSETNDEVNELPEPAKHLKSTKSRHSSIYASELESKIDKERKERLRIQKEIEELKQKLSQVQLKDN